MNYVLSLNLGAAFSLKEKSFQLYDKGAAVAKVHQLKNLKAELALLPVAKVYG